MKQSISIMFLSCLVVSITSLALAKGSRDSPKKRKGRIQAHLFSRIHEVNRDVCGTLLNTARGSFSSTNVPSNYSNNTSCVWLISVPEEQVSLTFDNFSIEYSPNCSSDYVRIYDGPSRSSPLLLNNTCGNTSLPAIIASTNQMLVEFVRDSNSASSGFRASYNQVQCGGTFMAATSTITSPGYDAGFYPPNLNCEFNIYAPPGYKITLNGSYDIQSSQFCYADRLTIYGSGVVGTPRYIYCGANTFSIRSTGNRIMMTFQSNVYGEQRGFNMTYSISK